MTCGFYVDLGNSGKTVEMSEFGRNNNFIILGEL